MLYASKRRSYGIALLTPQAPSQLQWSARLLRGELAFSRWMWMGSEWERGPNYPASVEGASTMRAAWAEHWERIVGLAWRRKRKLRMRRDLSDGVGLATC